MPNRRDRWEREEVAALRRMYGTRSNAEIALKLGKSESSVATKACRLELTKSEARRSEVGRQNVAERWGRPRSRRSSRRG